jgi:hypothetical protein
MCPEWRTLDDVGLMMLKPWEFTWTNPRAGHLVRMGNVTVWSLLDLSFNGSKTQQPQQPPQRLHNTQL